MATVSEAAARTTAAISQLSLGENASESGLQKLQDVLPEINEIAKKVGGYRRLAAIINDLAGQEA